MKERYFGSVRFFKNLILLAVIVAISIPSVLAVRYHRALSAQTAAVRDTVQSGEPSARPEELSAQTGDTSASSAQGGASSAGTGAPPEESGGSDAIGEVPAYAELYPDFYAPETLTADQHTDKTIYLTFDDGPSDRTDEILQILKDKDVKATFFVIGKSDAVSAQRMRSIVDGGHTLGMHTFSHSYKKIYASVDAYLADMYQIFCLIRDTTGVTPSVFRLPGGSINGYNYGIYQQILAEMLRRGFVPCDWNLSSGDASGEAITKQQILTNVVSAAANVTRGFVLMHDASDKKTTVSALPEMIDGLKNQGFSFDRLTSSVRPVLFGYTDSPT